MSEEMKRLDADAARAWLEKLFLLAGVSEAGARSIARGLVEASLRGIDTHGIRLAPTYLREILGGRANPRPRMKVDQIAASISKIDADGSVGILAGMKAADEVSCYARKMGVGVVSVSNANHFGAATIYALPILDHRLIGLISTSAASRMAPYGGKGALFGTNPLCFCAPGRNGDDYLLDMATSQISYSEVKQRVKLGEPMEPGWATDADGLPTTDSSAVAALSPLGGYKGQGLAMMMQVLTCLLSDSPLDHELSHLDKEPFDSPRFVSLFFLALDPSRFLARGRFETRLSDLLGVVRQWPSANPHEPVLVAGDPERACRMGREASGIPVSDEEVELLLKYTNELGLARSEAAI